MDLNLVFVKVFVQKCSLLFVVLVVYRYEFVCWTKQWILIRACVFRLKITLLYAIIIVKSGSNFLNFHLLVVNTNWLRSETFKFLEPINFVLVRELIFELDSKTVQKAKIKWCLLYFWRMGIALSKNKKVLVVNLLLLLFIRLIILFVWLFIIVLMGKNLV